jgi:hypothetical protein
MLMITREFFKDRLRKRSRIFYDTAANDVTVSVIYCPYCGHDEEYYSILPYSCNFCGKVFKWITKVVVQRDLNYQLKFYLEGSL